MFAVVQFGSLQFKVAEGDVIEAFRFEGKEGDKINVEKILLVSDGKTVKVGAPYVKGAKVAASIVSHPRAPKVIAFKYRKRKDSARTHGHRQDLTRVKIEKISL